MSDQQETIKLNENEGVFSFSNRLIGSPAFFELFEKGMTLVEEAANYLDVEGREESKLLEREGSLAYATESMRLTTRLMQLASWLLLQRAVSEGEMTLKQAQEEKQKVKLKRQSIVSNEENWSFLPIRLQNLIQRSMRLQDQVIHFDEALLASEEVSVQEKNPLAGHMNLLTEAFSK